MFAYRLVRANSGSPGVDGMDFEDIEQKKIGIDAFLSELAQDLKDKTYTPSPVRRVMIPKVDGSQRPLGIPTIRDRVAQMAVKLVIEPIFEADFCPNSYGFRPKKSAHDAVDEIAEALHQGTHKSSMPTCRNTLTAFLTPSCWPLWPSGLWMVQFYTSSNYGSKRRSSGRTRAVPGEMWVAGKPTVKARRKAASSRRCWRIATCICLTGYGESINYAGN
ncbi:MAG: reverse transcriptase domain-containing protein [Nitrosomonas sp.]|nr:reverse transcriptase domain-containing protein [Nitrosomonas sp.]MDP3664138.1 reverse transcriptase domain-containing protein [Nitrosomonas sp.]MDZ4106094.1 reverse transcriptase domain-containing protein [Nitrosomonas sp.]